MWATRAQPVSHRSISGLIWSDSVCAADRKRANVILSLCKHCLQLLCKNQICLGGRLYVLDYIGYRGIEIEVLIKCHQVIVALLLSLTLSVINAVVTANLCLLWIPHL